MHILVLLVNLMYNKSTKLSSGLLLIQRWCKLSLCIQSYRMQSYNVVPWNNMLLNMSRLLNSITV